MLETDRFPTLGALQRLRGMSNAVSIEDIRNALRIISDPELFIETVVGISDLILDSNPSVSPHTLVDRLGPYLGASLTSALFIAVLAQKRDWHVQHLAFGTSNSPLGSTHVAIDGTVTMFEATSRGATACNTPIEAHLDILRSPYEYCRYLDVQSAYRNPQLATRIALINHKLLGPADDLGIDILDGVDFIVSLERHNIHRTPGLLERVYFLVGMAALGRIADVDGAQVHPVRCSIDPNSSQRERGDGAKLWRCVLAKKGAGFRLQYWLRPGEVLELHNIITESDI